MFLKIDSALPQGSSVATSEAGMTKIEQQVKIKKSRQKILPGFFY